jgi:hypothetical protein
MMSVVIKRLIKERAAEIMASIEGCSVFGKPIDPQIIDDLIVAAHAQGYREGVMSQNEYDEERLIDGIQRGVGHVLTHTEVRWGVGTLLPEKCIPEPRG